MRKIPTLLLTPLLALAGAFSVPATLTRATPATSAPPPVGPGAVLDCVHRILAASDAGDREPIAKLLAPFEHVYALDAPGEGRVIEAKAGELAFADVDAFGRPVTAADAKGAVELLVGSIGGAERSLRSMVTSARADCPSAGCSWAVVDFERRFVRDGRQVAVPFRVTALARYGGDVAHMRIYSWHCSMLSPVASAVPAAPAAKTAKQGG